MSAFAALPPGFIDRATSDIEFFRSGPEDGETDLEARLRDGQRRDALRGLIGHGDKRGMPLELVQTIMRRVYGAALEERFEEDWAAAQERRRHGIRALSSQ
ncbi:MAG: hypothetical protein ACAI38_15615 [Myxococcota bacterium]|nr:hypothetical protein [Myxococcota bacterium]